MHRAYDQWSSWDKSLWLPFAPGSQAAPPPSVYSLPGECDLPAVPGLLSVEVRSPPSLQYLSGGEQLGVLSEAVGTGAFQAPFLPRSQAAPRLSCPDPARRDLASQEYRHMLTGPQEGQAPARDS